MNREKVNSLLEKYWNAETSLEEERLLREYFAQSTEENGPASNLFRYFAGMADESFTKEVELAPRKTAFPLKYILSIAASVILVGAAFFLLQPVVGVAPASNEVVLDDPEKAWELTVETLSFLNGQVTKGEVTLKENLIHFDKTFIFKS